MTTFLLRPFSDKEALTPSREWWCDIITLKTGYNNYKSINNYTEHFLWMVSQLQATSLWFIISHSINCRYNNMLSILGFPDGSAVKESACQCRRCSRCRFDPCVGKIPWRRKRQSTPVFQPGKFHRQRNLPGHSIWGCKESVTTEHSSTLSRLDFSTGHPIEDRASMLISINLFNNI